MILSWFIICYSSSLNVSVCRSAVRFSNILVFLSLLISSSRWFPTEPCGCDGGGGRASGHGVPAAPWTPRTHHLLEERWSHHRRQRWEDNGKHIRHFPVENTSWLVLVHLAGGRVFYTGWIKRYFTAGKWAFNKTCLPACAIERQNILWNWCYLTRKNREKGCCLPFFQ